MDEPDQTRIARPIVVDLKLHLRGYYPRDALRIEGMVGSMHKLLDEDLQGHVFSETSDETGLIFSDCIIDHTVIAQIVKAFPLKKFKFIIFEHVTVHEPSFFQKIRKPYFDVEYIECRGICNIKGILHFLPVLEKIVFIVDNKNLQNIILCFKDIYANTKQFRYGGGHITLKIYGKGQFCNLTEEIEFPKFGESCFNRVNCVDIDFPNGELKILDSTIKSLCLNKALRTLKLNHVVEFQRNKKGELAETIFQFGSLFEEDNSLVNIDANYKNYEETAPLVHKRLMWCKGKFDELEQLRYVGFSLYYYPKMVPTGENINSFSVGAMIEIVSSSKSLIELQLYRCSLYLEDTTKDYELLHYLLFLNRGGIEHNGYSLEFMKRYNERGINKDVLNVISQFIGTIPIIHHDFIGEHYKEWSRNNGFGGKPIKFALVNREQPSRIYVFVITNMVLLVLFKTVYTIWNLHSGQPRGLINDNLRINFVLSTTEKDDVRELLSNLNTMQNGLLEDVPMLSDFRKMGSNPVSYILRAMKKCGLDGLKLILEDENIVNLNIDHRYQYYLYI